MNNEFLLFLKFFFIFGSNLYIINFMKNVWKYIVVIILFCSIMGFIIVYFTGKRNNIKLINDGKYLLNYLNKIEEGNYTFDNGQVYYDNALVSNESFINGNGEINKDKYGNIEFNIITGDKCIYKTYMGEVKLDDKCPSKKSIDVEINRNNKQISFVSKFDYLEYMISDSDDFIGSWVKMNGGSIVINTFNVGDNYVWFKDKDGNLSKTYTFSVDCFRANKLDYDNNLFYCIGSIVKLDNYEWIVINSNSQDTTLMMKNNLDDRYSMCDKEKSEFCFYTEKEKKAYRWSNSKVEHYLNNDFYNKLSDNTKNVLKKNSICDEYLNSGCTNNMGCGGYLKETIDKHEYYCSSYYDSYVRIITYEEYNRLYKYYNNTNLFKGNYWILNAYEEDYASTVESIGSVFTKEDPTKKRNVRAVIVLSK